MYPSFPAGFLAGTLFFAFLIVALHWNDVIKISINFPVVHEDQVCTIRFMLKLNFSLFYFSNKVFDIKEGKFIEKYRI